MGAERDHHAAALSRRPSRSLSSLLCLLTLGPIALGLSGCGDGDGDPAPAGERPAAGGGGELAYAVPRLSRGPDPLLARDRVALAIARQIHEPLVARLDGPYGQSRDEPGLALSLVPSAGATVWTVGLRPGVRFQDGLPFDAEAVRINAERWRSSAAGRRLLPSLFAVDAPRPGEVRFLFERSVADLPARLASPRLGLVSPRALTRRVGEGLRRRAGDAGSGTGPFELSERTSGRLRLDRNHGWWGTPAGLGPALDTVVFVRAESESERLRLLREGAVRVAEPLGPASLEAIADDPLLTALAGPSGAGLGMESSVRGLDSALAVPLLSGVWLTTIGS